jgi:acetyl esterase/lipase
MSEESLKIREEFKKSDDIRDAGLVIPEYVEAVYDICYGEDEYWQSLDVYRPKFKDGVKLPVIVSVHGGAWVYGDKERYRYYCMSLVKYGFAVVNYTYRLAPEFKFPASVEDTNMVFAWILENAEKYGLDTDNIFALGDSAGAHLLGMYANILTNKEYADKFVFKNISPVVLKGVALNCGAYVITMSESSANMPIAVMRDLLPEEYLKGAGNSSPDDASAAQSDDIDILNVAKYVTSKFPPTFLMTCTGDFLAVQAPVMESALMKAGVSHTLRYYSVGDKELGHVFHCNMKLDMAHQCNAEECGFFKSLM